jgi:diadenosine tetraphosphate (Ap4A) HIT family hydrolase
MSPPGGCPSCFPAPERVAFEEALVRGLWDAFPVNPGHMLVVPRRHVPTWFEASREELEALVAAVARARALIEERYSPDGFNIGVNVGAAAGQTVPHLHLRVIPRYPGDVADRRGGVRHVIPARGNYLAGVTPGSAPRSGADATVRSVGEQSVVASPPLVFDDSRDLSRPPSGLPSTHRKTPVLPRFPDGFAPH